MSGTTSHQSRGAISADFAAAAVTDKSCGQKRSYVSFRVSAEEKAALEADAAGESLSAYVRDRVFDTSRRAKASYSIQDQQALARVLRALASSNLALDLEAIAEASSAGELPVTDALAARLELACSDVAVMRLDLIKALGLRPK